MIDSMELQRPRITPVLPQWDLGVVLEALSKSPYEPLREASFKHLTLKTVFLLAMASAGRRSELDALRFDQNSIQFKPKGAGVTLYFSPEFMRKNEKPNQVNNPWYIPAIPTGKPEFFAPNCPVRALRYYHKYLTEHPELRKDRRRLFVPIKDSNAGKELSASSISRWIWQGWPCPFASSPLAIENSTWLSKSASDEFSGEDTNQLSHWSAVKTLQSLETDCCQTMFLIYAQFVMLFLDFHVLGLYLSIT